MSKSGTVHQLKVPQLRHQLETRSLDAKGVKQTLVNRLIEAIAAEGHNVDTFLFPMDSEEDDTATEEMGDEEVDVEGEEELNETPADEQREEDEVEQTATPDVPPSDDATVAPNDEQDDLAAADTMGNVELPEQITMAGEGQEEGDQQEDISTSDTPLVTTETLSVASASHTSTTAPRAKCLWISGLAPSTRAADLKLAFTVHGKVTAAKIISSAAPPHNNQCYGFVSMTTADEAKTACDALHEQEINGAKVNVELTKNDSLQAMIKSLNQPAASSSATVDAVVLRTVKREVKSPDADKRRIQPAQNSPKKSLRVAPRHKQVVRRSAAGGSSRDRVTYSNPARATVSARIVARSTAATRARALATNARRHQMIKTRVPARERLGAGHAPRPHRTPIMTVRTSSGRRIVSGGGGGGYMSTSGYGGYVPPPPPHYESRDREERMRIEREKQQLQLDRERLEKEKLELQNARLRMEMSARRESSARHSSSTYDRSRHAADRRYVGGEGGPPRGQGGRRTSRHSPPSSRHDVPHAHPPSRSHRRSPPPPSSGRHGKSRQEGGGPPSSRHHPYEVSGHSSAAHRTTSSSRRRSRSPVEHRGGGGAPRFGERSTYDEQRMMSMVGALTRGTYDHNRPPTSRNPPPTGPSQQLVFPQQGLPSAPYGGQPPSNATGLWGRDVGQTSRGLGGGQNASTYPSSYRNAGAPQQMASSSTYNPSLWGSTQMSSTGGGLPSAMHHSGLPSTNYSSAGQPPNYDSNYGRYAPRR